MMESAREGSDSENWCKTVRRGQIVG